MSRTAPNAGGAPGYPRQMGPPAAAVPHDRDDSPREDHVVPRSGLDWADPERLLAARGGATAARRAHRRALRAPR